MWEYLLISRSGGRNRAKAGGPIAVSFESLRNIELTLPGGYFDRFRVMLGPFCKQMLGAIHADALTMGIGSVT